MDLTKYRLGYKERATVEHFKHLIIWAEKQMQIKENEKLGDFYDGYIIGLQSAISAIYCFYGVPHEET